MKLPTICLVIVFLLPDNICYKLYNLYRGTLTMVNSFVILFDRPASELVSALTCMIVSV